ncbi:MAG: cation transporter [Longimicrobiales bacterium]
MRRRRQFQLPGGKAPAFERARRLEWLSVILMATVIAAVGLTMGASQAMKAAWVEDILSLVPPIAFLVSARYRFRDSTQRFPYGYHRAVSISFLTGAVALTGFGLFILIDSSMGLVRQEHPTIGTMVVFGQQFWAGWAMIGALVYSVIPPLVLGHLKLPLAEEIHDKTLKADADMNKGDWLTALAGIVGILGIGIGWWWADSVAAGIISLEIVKDGVQNLKRVIADLMDERPTTIEGQVDAIPAQMREALLALPWVADADVRVREEGDVLAGEAYIVMREERDVVRRFAEAGRMLSGLHWRVHDIVLTAVPELAQQPDPIPPPHPPPVDG